jgi:hypothetical protein
MSGSRKEESGSAISNDPLLDAPSDATPEPDKADPKKPTPPPIRVIIEGEKPIQE